MTKTKWMTMAAVLTLSASLAVAAPHEGFGGGKRGGHGRAFGQHMAEKLNLTAEQQQQIRGLQESFRETNKAFFENAHALRKELRAAKQANDTAKLDALKPQLDAQRAQMRQLHEAQEAKIAAVLTPEQRTQWETMKAERQQRREKRRGDRF